MRMEQFNALVDEQLNYCTKLLKAKGTEYSKDVDRLSTFKKAGILQNETPKQALLGMLAKHLVSIADMCNAPQKESTARWVEKIGDSINYLILLRAIVEEENASNE